MNGTRSMMSGRGQPASKEVMEFTTLGYLALQVLHVRDRQEPVQLPWLERQRVLN